MSEVKVNKLSPRSGTTVTLGDSGDTITVPSGATLDASNATTTLPANVITTDGSQTLTNKTIDASQLTDATVTPAKLAYNYNQFRNIVINGDMSIAQRGTSATGLGNGDNGYFTCDRWKLLESGTTTYEFTQSQSTDVPSGQGFATSLKMDCTTADASLDAANLIRIVQIIESQNLQYLKYGTANATSLTLSFWVKSTVTGDYNVNLYNYGSGGGARIISSIYTINSADTWEKKTITFAGDTVEAFLNDNTSGLNLAFSLGSGTDYTTTDATSWGSFSNGKLAYGQVANIASSTANNFYITGVQLEAGTTASDFEFLPFDMNKNRCLRYYEVLAQGAGQAIGYGGTYIANLIGFNITYTEKRVIPSFDQTSGTNYYRFYNGSTNYLTNLTIGNIATKNRSLVVNSEKTISDNSLGWIANFDASAYIALDAEL